VPAAAVADLERGLGSYGTAGQLQQRPAPAEGGLIKRAWFRFWHYPGNPLPPVRVRQADGGWHTCPCVPIPVAPAAVGDPWPVLGWTQQAQSWDCAFKDTAGSDYVAGGTWAQRGADCYLLTPVVHARLNVLGTVQAIRAQSDLHPGAGAKWIEEAANGAAVITILHSEIPGLIPVRPDGGKRARVQAIAPMIESGNVYLPHPSLDPAVDLLLTEAAGFPSEAHDDLVDQMTQALYRLRARRTMKVA